MGNEFVKRNSSASSNKSNTRPSLFNTRPFFDPNHQDHTRPFFVPNRQDNTINRKEFSEDIPQADYFFPGVGDNTPAPAVQSQEENPEDLEQEQQDREQPDVAAKSDAPPMTDEESNENKLNLKAQPLFSNPTLPLVQREQDNSEDEESQQEPDVMSKSDFPAAADEENKEEKVDDIQTVAETASPQSEEEDNQENLNKKSIQTKLTVGKPGDKYEQEADATAAKVVEQINSPTTEQLVQGKVEPVAKPTLMRQGGIGGGTVNQNTEQSIQQAKGSGQSLAENVREPMEHAFGTDFSGVKVHTGGEADTLNRSLNSRAFATGQDIFFKQGEYNPGSKQGQELLAHELTHVVQQGGQQLQAKSNLSNQKQESLSSQKRLDAKPGGFMGLSDSTFLWRMVQTKFDLVSQSKDYNSKNKFATDLNQNEVVDSFASPINNQTSIQAKCSECGKEEQIQKQTTLSTPSGEESIQAFGWDDIENAASAGANWVGDQASDAADWVGDRVDDVAELGADAFASIVERISPNLAALIRNGPEALLNDTLEGGIEEWLQGILGDIDIGVAITELQSSLGSVFSTLQGVINGDSASCEAFAEGINSLKELAQSFMENPAIQAIQDAFATVSNAFQTVTNFVVAPIFDTLMEVAGGVFNRVQAVAGTIWEWGGAVRDYLSDAWDWVLEQLGIGGDGEGGILEWLQEQASAVWDGIKETFAPVIGPLKTVLKTMVTFSPAGPFLAAVKYGPQIVESVQWLWNNKDNPDIVQAAHEQMGNTILPQLLSGAQNFSGTLQSTATTLINGIVQMSEGVLELLGSISGVPLLGITQNFVQNISTNIQNFAAWCQESFQGAVDAVQSLFTKIQEVVAPYAEVLSSLALAIVNPTMIPVILAGWAWRAIPDCYKPPIINFLLDAIIGILQVLPELPIMGPLWSILKTGVLGFLEGVKGRDDNEKIAITNKLAKIISGASPAFMFGFIKGLLKGIWEGITDPFILMYTAIQGLGNLIQWLNDTANAAFDNDDSASAPSPSSESTITQATSEYLSSESSEASFESPAQEQSAEGTIPPSERQSIGQRMGEMAAELQPPAEQVTGGFMPAIEEVFSGGEGMSYEELGQKLGEAWEAVQNAVQSAGQDLANRVCEFLLQDSAEGEMGEAVGWLAGTIAFEVVLGILTAGSVTAAKGVMKVLKIFAKVLDWTGEVMGVAFKGLAKLGGFVLDVVKGIGKLLSNAGGAARVVMDGIREIGEKLLRFADELLGTVGRGASGEAAETAAERTARETAEAGAERTAREAAEAGSERAAQEAAEAGAERTTREVTETSGERTTREGVEETGEEVGERGVVATTQTRDGHTIKVLEDGRIARCSSCEILDQKYGHLLNNDKYSDYRKLFDEVNALPPGAEKASRAAELESRLANLEEVQPFINRSLDDMSLKDLPDGYYHYATQDGSIVISRKNANSGYPPLTIETVDGRQFIREGAARSSNRISKSGKLARNLGGSVPNHEAHHLIPDAVVRDHELTQMAMQRGRPPYDLDDASNGIFLPSNADGVKVSPDLPLHRGSHPQWNRTAEGQLDALRADLIDEYGDLNAVPADVLTQSVKEVENQLRSEIGDLSRME